MSIFNLIDKIALSIEGKNREENLILKKIPLRQRKQVRHKVQKKHQMVTVLVQLLLIQKNQK